MENSEDIIKVIWVHYKSRVYYPDDTVKLVELFDFFVLAAQPYVNSWRFFERGISRSGTEKRFGCDYYVGYPENRPVRNYLDVGNTVTNDDAMFEFSHLDAKSSSGIYKLSDCSAELSTQGCTHMLSAARLMSGQFLRKSCIEARRRGSNPDEELIHSGEFCFPIGEISKFNKAFVRTYSEGLSYLSLIDGWLMDEQGN